MSKSNLIIKDINIKEKKIQYKNTIYNDIISKNQNLLPLLNHKSVEFKVIGTNNALMNSIRRCFIDELKVKVMDIKIEDVYTDDSFIIADIIKDRLSYVPLLQSIKDDVTFKLNISNNSLDIIPIYTSDLINSNKNDKTIYFNNQKLCYLNPNKKIMIDNVHISSNIGFKDNRYTIGYIEFKVINFDMEKNNTLNSNPTDFQLTLNSNGNIEPNKIILIIADTLIERLENIYNYIYNIENKLEQSSNMDITITINDNFTQYNINNEYHTIGNLLVTYIFNIDNTIKLLNYDVDHPLSNKLILKIQHVDANKILLSAIQNIIADFNKIKSYF